MQDMAKGIDEMPASPVSRRPRSLWSHLRELGARRDLILIMTVSQVRARYQQAILGIAWAVLQPLALMFVFTVIFSKMLNVQSEGIPYSLFSYSGLVFWSFFSTSLLLGVPSLITYAPIVKKIYFPREIFILVTIFATFIDLLAAGAVFLVMMLFYDVALTWTALWVFPLLVTQTIFTFGVVLIGATLCVKFRDIRWGIPVLTQLWMFGTPIIYSLDSVPDGYKRILLLNPMTAIIDGYRRVLIHGTSPQLLYFSISAVISVLVFYFGYRYFKSRELTFADIL